MKHLKIEQSTTSAESVTKEQLSRLNEVVKGSALDASSNLKGKLTAPTAYIQDVEELTERFSDLTINVTGEQYVRFDDPVVKAIAVAKWDKDADGYLTEAEVAVVTLLDGYFQADTEITSFDELRYFTGMTSIGSTSGYNGPFMNCTALRSVILPPSVETIGVYAFTGCSALTSVGDMSNVKRVLGQAFRACTSLNIDVNLPLLTEIGNSFGGSNIKSVIDLGSITSLPNGSASTNASTVGAFGLCTSLTDVNLPTSLRTIGSYSFYGATALARMNGGINVETINNYAFSQCQALAIDVNFPSLKNLGTGAFERSGVKRVVNLGEIDFDNWTNSITYGEFSRCTSLEEVILPNSCTKIGWHTFNGDTALKSIQGLERVTRLGGQTFYNCKALEIDVNMPLLTEINSHCFYGSGIKSISDLGFLETITGSSSSGQGVFNSCTKLETVVLPSSLRTIGAYSFYNCNALTRMKIAEGLTTIGDQALNGLNSLEGIVFPSTFSSSGKRIIYSSSKLQAVVFMGNTPPTGTAGDAYIWNVNATGMHANLKFYVPDSAVDAYKASPIFHSTYVNRIMGYSELFSADYIPECIVDFYDKLIGDGTAYAEIATYNAGESWEIETEFTVLGSAASSLYHYYDRVWTNSLQLMVQQGGYGTRAYAGSSTYMDVKPTGMAIGDTYKDVLTITSGSGTVHTLYKNGTQVGTANNGGSVPAAGVKLRVISGQTAAARSYKVKINGVLTHDLRPAMLVGEVGLYDTVAHKFYKNSNTSGSFTVSND